MKVVERIEMLEAQIEQLKEKYCEECGAKMDEVEE